VHHSAPDGVRSAKTKGNAKTKAKGVLFKRLSSYHSL
jgi:hypothetical protein